MSAGKFFWVVRRPPDKGAVSRRRAGGWVPSIQKPNPPLAKDSLASPLIRGAKKQSGFTLLAMLLVVAATGAVLASIGELASHAMPREKEKQLLFAGQQYREAIASYYNRTPGAVKRYPASLSELLEDKRFPMPQRHLRRLYPDPVTGQGFTPVESPEGGIMGVHSPSEAEPVKSANFLLRDADFTDARKYSDWKFVYRVGN